MLGRMPWIVSCLFSPSLALAQANFTFFEPVDPPRKVQIMVHRGMHMLAPEIRCRPFSPVRMTSSSGRRLTFARQKRVNMS